MYLNLDDTQKDFLKSQLEVELNKQGADIHSTQNFHCPICKQKKKTFHFIPNTNYTRWKCFHAEHVGKDNGDIFELVQQIYGIDFPQACKYLAEQYNLITYSNGSYQYKKIEYTPLTKTVEQRQAEEQDEQERKNYLEFLNQYLSDFFTNNHIINENDCSYLTNRGISLKIQQQYNVIYVKDFVHPKTLWRLKKGEIQKVYPTSRVILPTSKDSFLARATFPEPPKTLPNGNTNPQYKYFIKAYKVGNTNVFNASILKDNVGYCFIFEGEIDALSAIECGYNATGLGSTEMIDRFFKTYKINHKNVLIISLDNDEGGQKKVPKAINWCKNLKIPYIVADSNQLFNGAKDCNQALQENRITLQNNLEWYKNQALQFDRQAYLQTLENENPIENVSKTTPIPTITYENIKSKEVLEYAYTLTSKTDIAQYFDMLLTKAKEFNLTGYKSLIAPYREQAIHLLKEHPKCTINDGVVWTKNKFGELTGSLTNCINVLTQNQEYNQHLKYNEFATKIIFNGQPINDDWITNLRKDLVTKYQLNNTIKSDTMDAVSLVSKYNSFHPVKEYFNNLPQWDKIPRLETIFIDYLGAKDTPYTRKIAKITMISAIARIKEPGCWVDTITCLVGKQGIGKSKFIQKLAVNRDWFNDGITSFDGKEFYEGIQGKWIVELSEGTAFKKSTKEIAKQRATATKDTYRLPYATLPEDRPRQCIFMATVNDYNFLKDETGNRRYYPIDCTKSKAKYTFNDLTPEIVAQIWAEALMLYNQGEKWYLDDAEKQIIEMAIYEQQNHYENSTFYDDMFNFLNVKIPNDWYKLPLSTRRNHIHSVLNDTYGTYIDGTPIRLAETNTRQFISTKEILYEYFEKDKNEIFPGRDKLLIDIQKALKELGYISIGRKYIGGYGQERYYELEK